ncbi:MAG: cation diffusion facilitator family transporter [Candidatus Promineifilaceae bacterium]
MTERRSLTRYAWLSIAAALATIGLKVGAYLLTGSVGLLSDALESGANLIAAVVALIVLTIAARPPDEEHEYGHSKAEYFASGVEGTLIVVAAASISYSAVERLLHPQGIERVGIGLIVSVLAALLNLAVSRILLQAGRQHHSITLVADAQHLMTDVWTSIGVVVAVGVVGITGWQILDPLIALAVAVQILYTGGKLMKISVSGLMDTALPADEVSQITAILDQYAVDGVQYHALRTRGSGAQRFMSVHIQVPGDWSVQQGHSLLEEIEHDVRQRMAPISVFTHIEPVEDPRSWEDISILRESR